MSLLLNIPQLLPLALEAAPHGQTFWLPAQGSTSSQLVDQAFYFVFWVCFFFSILIFVWLGAFLWRYRERAGHKERDTPHHNNTLEITWSVIPLAIVCYMFWIGFRGFHDLYTPPGNGMNIHVQAQKWSWNFTYPNGVVTGMEDGLHVPAGQNVILTMASSDVIHSLFIPDFRVKKDVVPGRYHKVWFNALKPGVHNLFCTEYCGTNHSAMFTKVIVEDQAAFDAWLKAAGEFDDKIPMKEAGERWYKNMGCGQCHSLDGTTIIGPTFKNLWLKQEAMADGKTFTVDENYIRESILNPSAHVVKGYQNVMPSFQGRLEDKSITNIVAFIESLSDQTSPERLEQISKTPEKGKAGGAGGDTAAGATGNTTGEAATDEAGSAPRAPAGGEEGANHG